MIIAQKLRKSNICEYLLYMWQVEDILRAFRLDAESLEASYLKQFQLEQSALKEVREWYDSLVEMMKLEGVSEKGHLQLNKNIIIDLEDFHALLMKTGKVPAYNAKFYHILPLIHKVRMQGDTQSGDLEQCFNFQYGIMMLRLQKKEITPDTLRTQEEISKFMVLLAKHYKAFQSGELDLDEGIL